MRPRARLTVVVPTFRRVHLLPRLLQELASQKRKHDDAELMVIDNAGEREVADVVAREAARAGVEIRYIVQSKLGISEVRNLGLCISSADFVAFVDDDIIPGKSWMSAVLRATSTADGIQMFGGPIEPVDDLLRPIDMPKSLEPCCGVQRYSSEPFDLDASSPRMLIGGNLILHRTFAIKVGGFHAALGRRGNNVGSLEDHEFFIRFTRAGGRGRFDPALHTITIVPTDRLSKEYSHRWRAGHGYYSSLLDYLMVSRGDERAVASSVARSMLPAWVVRELVSLLVVPGEAARERREFLKGYLRGVAQLISSPSLRNTVRSRPPLATQ